MANNGALEKQRLRALHLIISLIAYPAPYLGIAHKKRYIWHREGGGGGNLWREAGEGSNQCALAENDDGNRETIENKKGGVTCRRNREHLASNIGGVAAGSISNQRGHLVMTSSFDVRYSSRMACIILLHPRKRQT